MNFKKLTCTIKETNEFFVLYDGDKFQNFDKLHKIAGWRYTNLNDDLMNGPSVHTWGYDDPYHPVYYIYDCGEVVKTLLFEYE